MRTADVALHDLDSGKWNRQGARHVQNEGAGETAAGVGYAFAKATSCSKYINRGVVLSLLQRVRVMGIRGSGPSRVLAHAQQPRFPSQGSTGRIQSRSAASVVQVRCLAYKSDKTRAGCTITRFRLADARETGGASMGAFEALANLLHTRELVVDDQGHVVRMESVLNNRRGRSDEVECRKKW